MLGSTILLAAALAATPAATVDTTRAAYTKCLRGFLLKSLKDKMPTAEFEISVKSACPDEQAAFHAAVVAFDRAAGDKLADATDNADMQVADYVDNFTAKFVDYTDSGTLPADE